MEATASTLSFDQIYHQSRNSKSFGKLKLANGGLGWKESATGSVITLPAADFSSLSWLKAMRGHELRIYLKDGSVQKFDGFPADTLDELKDYIQENYKLTLELREKSVKGCNWGKLEIDGNHLEFKVSEKVAFDLPLTEVTNATVSAKEEIAIEFAQPETVDKKNDTLVEVRFYVPGQETVEDNEDKEEEDLDMAKSLCEKIKGFSELNQVAGEKLVSLPELPCIVPRGRFALDMSATALRLHGKSYDHKILYSSIVKVFLLPKADDAHVLFVLALDPPIRQGQTRYPFLVFQFPRDDEIEVDLQNIDEETIKTKYEGKLQLHYDAPTFEVVSNLFRLIAGQKIIVPGSFRSHTGENSIKCALKANEGYLFPLERNFLFLPKPVTLIPHSDISQVEFSRMGAGLGNPRSFDMKFFLKSGQEISLSNLAKVEYSVLEEFMQQKSIDFRSKDEERRVKREASDYGSEDEEELNLKRPREEESSPDEDYEEGENDESSVDEEYDSEAGSDNEDGEEEDDDDDQMEEDDDEDESFEEDD